MDATTLKNPTPKRTGPTSAAESLKNLAALLPSSVSTTDDPDAAWESLQEKRARDEFFARHWPLSNVPPRALERIKSCEFTGEAWLKADAKIQRLLAARRGALIALVGLRGPGKTQLAACALHRACTQMRLVRYIKALDFFAEIRAAYGPTAKESEREVINRFCKPSVLVIDGMEERGDTKWEDRMLSHVFDRRYDDMTDTIGIANLKEDAFCQSIGPSAESRLRETGGIISCDWPSFRG